MRVRRSTMQLRCAGDEACTYFVWNAEDVEQLRCLHCSEISDMNCFGLLTLTRYDNILPGMFQAEMHECELEIEPNGFGDCSSLHLSATIPRPFSKENGSLTSRTQKMIQLWFDLRDFFQANEWVQHTDLTILHMHCTSFQWQRTYFILPGFHIRCFYAFSAFQHHHPVLEFGGSNHHHLWTYSIQSLAHTFIDFLGCMLRWGNKDGWLIFLWVARLGLKREKTATAERTNSDRNNNNNNNTDNQNKDFADVVSITIKLQDSNASDNGNNYNHCPSPIVLE